MSHWLGGVPQRLLSASLRSEGRRLCKQNVGFYGRKAVNLQQHRFGAVEHTLLILLFKLGSLGLTEGQPAQTDDGRKLYQLVSRSDGSESLLLSSRKRHEQAEQA